MDQPTQIRPAGSHADSGPRIALRDVPGDWASITAVWTSAPEPLCDLAGRVTAGRHRADDQQADAAAIAMGCWAVLVLIPRGLLHLASWVLTHPLRVMAVAAVAAVLYATL